MILDNIFSGQQLIREIIERGLGDIFVGEVASGETLGTFTRRHAAHAFGGRRVDPLAVGYSRLIDRKQSDAAKLRRVGKADQRLAVAKRAHPAERKPLPHGVAVLVRDIQRGPQRRVAAGVLPIDAGHDRFGVGLAENGKRARRAKRQEEQRRVPAPSPPARPNCGGTTHSRSPRSPAYTPHSALATSLPRATPPSRRARRAIQIPTENKTAPNSQPAPPTRCAT